MNKKSTIALPIFVPSLVFAAATIILMLVVPDKAKELIDFIFYFFTYELGWMYLIAILVLLVFSLWIAFSKYGNICLGKEGEKKEYSNWSWTAMMFAAGMSVAVVVMGFAEPLKLLTAEPLGAAPFSADAYQYSHMYPQFFYGPIAWSIYGPASVAVAYSMYIKRDTVLRMSGACRPVLGKQTNGFLGVSIDVLVMLGMIGGVSTSLGLGTPAVTALIEHMTGIPQSTAMTIIVLIIWAILFSTSVFLGLDKGIKRLSDLNLYLLFGLLLVVFFITPINDWLYTWLNSIALVVDNIGLLTLGSTVFAQGTFTQDWTVFYWAWWLGFMPMMALFGARISKGRTIRQLIFGEIVYGGGGSMLVFGLFGYYSLHLQKTGRVDLVSIVQNEGQEQALIAILETLPFSQIMLVLVLVLIFVFLATTLDSTAYTLACVCTKKLKADEHPSRFNRMTWAIVLLLFALGLVLIGGLQTVQTASILLGFPLIFISGVIMVAVLRFFKEHKF